MASKAGFYKRDGEELLFSGSTVTLPDGTILDVKNRQDYSFPVEGWSYYSSKKEALVGLKTASPIVPVPEKPIRENTAEKLLSRLESKNLERLALQSARESQRIARIEQRRPEHAERAKLLLEFKAAKRAQKMEERLSRLRARVHNRAATPEFNWPDNPKRFDTVTTPDGTQWRFDQPRDFDGTFSSDDPSTLKVESQMRWIPVKP